jgi:hypothetical protein
MGTVYPFSFNNFLSKANKLKKADMKQNQKIIGKLFPFVILPLIPIHHYLFCLPVCVSYIIYVEKRILKRKIHLIYDF